MKVYFILWYFKFLTGAEDFAPLETFPDLAACQASVKPAYCSRHAHCVCLPDYVRPWEQGGGFLSSPSQKGYSGEGQP